MEEKNVWFQPDSNSDHQSRKGVCWPIVHHHHCPSCFILSEKMKQWKETVWGHKKRWKNLKCCCSLFLVKRNDAFNTSVFVLWQEAVAAAEKSFRKRSSEHQSQERENPLGQKLNLSWTIKWAEGCRRRKDLNEWIFQSSIETRMSLLLAFFKKWTNPGLFFIYFQSSKTKNTIFTTIQCKKCRVHPVYGARIWTHDLSNMSRLPLALDQGSHPVAVGLVESPWALTSAKNIRILQCANTTKTHFRFRPWSPH